MLGLTLSFDPRNQGAVPWVIAQTAARGSISSIVGPVGSGKTLYMIALAVRAAADGKQVAAIISREHPSTYALLVGAAVQAADLDEATRETVRIGAFHHDATLSQLRFDTDDGLQQLEETLRAVDILIVDDIDGVFGVPSRAVMQRIAAAVRGSNAALVMVCRDNSAHEAPLRGVATTVLTLDRVTGGDVHVVYDTRGLAPSAPELFRITAQQVAVGTGDTVAVPALVAPPSLPSSVTSATPRPHGQINQQLVN